MSEWLKEHAWKACVGETLPWVRIPLSPPTSSTKHIGYVRDFTAYRDVFASWAFTAGDFDAVQLAASEFV
jgi:hypothetical protein